MTVCLIDVDNFFVSCEKIMRPDLENTPVVVLSNNDGCIVARSIEVKAIGIPMGAPLFQVKEAIDKHGVVVFSSNFALYSDISNRIMSILRKYSHNVEIYSIDEAFVDFSKFDERQHLEIGIAIRKEILQNIGVSVSIGIAPTKTLAKIATHIIKDANKEYVRSYKYLNNSFPSKLNREKHNVGVHHISRDNIIKVLQSTDIGEIWGIGRRLKPKLNSFNIKTCHDLVEANRAKIKQIIGINGLRIILELKGEKVHEVKQDNSIPKSMLSSRSFGSKTKDISIVKNAIASHVDDIATNMRRQKLKTTHMTIFLTSKRYDKNYYYKTKNIEFEEPTNSSRAMLRIIIPFVEHIFDSEYVYRKCGAFTKCIVSQNRTVRSLFVETNYEQYESKENLIDGINYAMGNKNIILAERGWIKKMYKQAQRSSRYTTNINEIITAK
jgi:DNA polymerase V